MQEGSLEQVWEEARQFHQNGKVTPEEDRVFHKDRHNTWGTITRFDPAVIKKAKDANGLNPYNL